jgi:uncharacterized membrane protein YhaH (DUF805 family)
VQDGLLGETRIPTAINGGAPPRAFGEAISVCFLKYVGFSGRASRSEFWNWVLFSILAGIVTGLIDLVFLEWSTNFHQSTRCFRLRHFCPVWQLPYAGSMTPDDLAGWLVVISS